MMTKYAYAGCGGGHAEGLAVSRPRRDGDPPRCRPVPAGHLQAHPPRGSDPLRLFHSVSVKFLLILVWEIRL